MTQLPNYLRSHRKRLALSQDEVAFLLGNKSGSKTSRHESFERLPTLMTAMAYEVIFQKPVRDLFGGMYQRVERDVIARTRLLLHKTHRMKNSPLLIRKNKTFAGIVAGQLNRINNDQ